MISRHKMTLGIVISLVLLLIAANVLIRSQALALVYSPMENRPPLIGTPADVSLPYKDVEVITTDGNTLHGWYVPSKNGAVIMGMHGYKWNRSGFLEEAEIFTRHGFGFLFMSVRAHDINEGELIGFGLNEMPDMQAWYQFLLTQDDVDPARIGLLGESLGGSMAIQYAAQNLEIKAVATHSAFSSMQDTIETSVTFFTGLPPYPFASMIQFWAERELGASINEVNASTLIKEISPRPIFIMHGLKDVVVSPQSGNILYDAALEPKELWLDSDLGHGGFELAHPEEFERRLVDFFERYLLN